MISIKNIKSDYLYLIWKDPVKRSRYAIGTLKKNTRYEFQYNKDTVEKCLKLGFSLLISFPLLEKKYTSKSLFPEFLSRIPGPNRTDITDILNKYSLQSYDAFELIKRSGAKTSLDTLEFIDPILNLKELPLQRDFYIAGTRHYCKKENENQINVGDTVILSPEPANEYDKYALKMIVNNIFVGYVPNYYSEIVSRYLKQKDSNYTCTIIAKLGNCEECLKVRLVLK